MKLHHVFHDPTLLSRALTHSSWAHEHPGDEHNEILEFQGDAVVKLVVTDMLLAAHPGEREGHLSERRGALVGTQSLAECARRLDLGPHIRFGVSESVEGREKPKILEDAFEAVIGAVYVDGGLDAARAEIVPLLAEAVAQPIERHPKTALQERCQAAGRPIPQYRSLGRTGPDHAPVFRCAVWVGEEPIAEGEGAKKQEAETAAARAALKVFAP